MERQIESTSAESTSSIPGTNYSNPAPIGYTVKTIIEGGHVYLTPRLYNLEITVLEMIRGAFAEEKLKFQGVTPEVLQDGMEYLLARIRFGFFQRGRGGSEEVYKLLSSQFAVISTDGKMEFELPLGSEHLSPQLIGSSFYMNESREGWVLIKVARNDAQPRLIFKREHSEGIYGIWSYVWFQLY